MDHDHQPTPEELAALDATPPTSAELAGLVRLTNTAGQFIGYASAATRDEIDFKFNELARLQAATANYDAAHSAPALLDSVFDRLNNLVHQVSNVSISTPTSQTPASPRAGAIKVRAPDAFAGCRPGSKTSVRNFITQCDINFNLQPLSFNTDRAKIMFASSYLIEDAFNWIQPYISASPDMLLDPTNSWFLTWEAFSAKLNQIFGDPDLKASAARKILLLKQETGVPVYTAEFRRLSVELTWNDETLRVLYYKGLKDSIKDQLSRDELPNTLIEIIVQAERIGNRQNVRATERDASKANSNTHNTSGSASHTTSRPRNDQGQYQQSPAVAAPSSNVPDANGDIQMNASRRTNQPSAASSNKSFVRGPLTDDEKNRRRTHGLCLYCGRSGHLFNDCPIKPARLASSAATFSLTSPNNIGLPEPNPNFGGHTE
ncbi:hypothetical protein P7C70_g4420, partial [Phenoliferia sp. Uapishka_3]